MKHYRVRIQATVEIYVTTNKPPDDSGYIKEHAVSCLTDALHQHNIQMLDWDVCDLVEKEVKLLVYTIALPVLPKDVERGKDVLVEMIRDSDGGDIIDAITIEDGKPSDEPVELT